MAQAYSGSGVISHNLIVKLQGILEFLQSVSDSRNIYDKLIELEDILKEFAKEISFRISDEFLDTITKTEELIELLSELSLHREDYNQLIKISKEAIDPILLHLIDVVEGENDKSMAEYYDSVFDAIENCNKLKIQVELSLNTIKEFIDIQTEFNEILADNIETLDSIIDENITDFFKIQSDRNASPIRHQPSFTLNKLIKLLTVDANAETSSKRSSQFELEPKLPVFSSFEKEVMNALMDLRKSLIPIETSIVEILPKRIKSFQDFRIGRFKKVSILVKVLDSQYKLILKKFIFLNNELKVLKREMIDDRWNVIFRNLNIELRHLMNELDDIYNKSKEIRYNESIEFNFKTQLADKTKIVSKTFNIIYKAIEFSLLDAGIVAETNGLAKRWVDLRPIIDNLLAPSRSLSSSVSVTSSLSRSSSLLSVESTSSGMIPSDFPKQRMDNDVDGVGNKTIESITRDLRKFSLASNMSEKESQYKEEIDSEMVKSKRKKYRTSILETMNIKPVLVFDNKSADEDNPFFDTSGIREENLVLGSLPRLSHREHIQQSLTYDHGYNNNNSDIENSTDSNMEATMIAENYRTNSRLLGEDAYMSYHNVSEVSTVANTPNSNLSKGRLVEKLEKAKWEYHAAQESKIPRINTNYSGVKSTNFYTTFEKGDIQIVDGKLTRHNRLRAPTPMSQLLTPVSNRSHHSS
ncbi:hypothetical protein KAFR_0B06470 [Kazachstania africana CBS 2517]|uniref:Karyogamy protein KAR9 n=1 Tax=Kazachstania africana (strain ATCC 22294 / BCRC 22015 / CBS 2517 / CECT 1963 / NBRC 1671 / NRRL Y-8276) TaxID=1071382 RepID=H2ARE3_KAZAF|nr:hypothetical protein KAFR_0B06470 [Kazachstania africana CBS 2517]CCF56943.1 hypothetical protein KAFR_0B06470 [Kazachstania africana CBS 2517]